MFILQYLRVLRKKDPLFLISRLFIIMLAGGLYSVVNETLHENTTGGQIIQALSIILAVTVVLTVVTYACSFAGKWDWGWALLAEIGIFFFSVVIIVVSIATSYFISAAAAAVVLLIEVIIALWEILGRGD